MYSLKRFTVLCFKRILFFPSFTTDAVFCANIYYTMNSEKQSVPLKKIKT